MKTNDDRQHLTQAQLRLAVTLFWGPCQQVLLPARLKELAKVVNGAKNRYSIHRNLPLLTKVCLLYPLHIEPFDDLRTQTSTDNTDLLSKSRVDVHMSRHGSITKGMQVPFSHLLRRTH